jgi:predicted RNA-binding protein with PIN domain
MAYLIDGHNLIPKLPGLSLKDPDDEMQLVKRLQEYSRRAHKKVEVYFDNAPPGLARKHNFGLVTAYFVPQGRTADSAIRARLASLGSRATHWTVVSSDRGVQVDVRAARARVMTAEAFACKLLLTAEGTVEEESKPVDVSLTEEEVQNWLQVFRGRQT